MCLLPPALFRASSGVAVFFAKDKPGGVIDEQRKCIGGTTPRCSTRLLVEPMEPDFLSSAMVLARALLIAQCTKMKHETHQRYPDALNDPPFKVSDGWGGGPVNLR